MLSAVLGGAVAVLIAAVVLAFVYSDAAGARWRQHVQTICAQAAQQCNTSAVSATLGDSGRGRLLSAAAALAVGEVVMAIPRAAIITHRDFPQVANESDVQRLALGLLGPLALRIGVWCMGHGLRLN